MTNPRPKRLSIAEKRAMTGLLNLGPEYHGDENPPEPDDPPEWSQAEPQNPSHKKPISLRMDPDVLAFFKSGGPGYQTRINAVLRAYMKAQRTFKKP